MKSIRLSLLLYFLGLLAVALGTASLLAYETARRALETARAAKEEPIRRQYRERCQEEEKALDKELSWQAAAIARKVRDDLPITRKEWEKGGYQKLLTLGYVGAKLMPNGQLLIPAWFAEGVQPPLRTSPREWRDTSLYGEIARHFVPRIPFNDETLAETIQHQPDFWQIDLRGCSSVRSGSLGSKVLLPHEDKGPFLQFDDVTLGGNLQVRRVVTRWPLFFNRSFGPNQFPPRGPRPPPPAGDNSRSEQALVVQCAYDIARRNAIRDKYQQRGDEDLANLQAETKESLARVRNRLLLVGSLTFLFALAGSVGLVRAGLLPLRRLSEAVSQISPRNFHLSLSKQRLPGELKPIVQRLTDMLDMLRRAFAREKQATADISHELRTPLAVMLTTTELGLRKPRTGDEYREMLADCRLSAQQMNEIVQRLLTLARLDAGADQLSRRPIDMVQLADQCASLVRPLAEARGLTLTMHAGKTLPLEGDPDKLREVINNLLHNAIQYNRPEGRIDLNVARDRDQVQVEVHDTGIGIEPEARSQIFERFYRADPSRGGDGLHAGLGLALVKEYVDLMGGRIDVESVVGQGSTFRVVLPVVNSESFRE